MLGIVRCVGEERAQVHSQVGTRRCQIPVPGKQGLTSDHRVSLARDLKALDFPRQT